MPATYDKIAAHTLPSNATSYTFSSIPSTYTDLVLIINSNATSNGEDWFTQLNGDTSTNYSYTTIGGTGSGVASSRASSQSQAKLNFYGYNTTTAGEANLLCQFMNYSNTTTNKIILTRSNAAPNGTSANVALWRSTAAINSIKIMTNSAQSYVSGSTFTLYGIKAA